MKCVECSVNSRKYKCPRCYNFCCCFDCFKKHKFSDCASGKIVFEKYQTTQLRKHKIQFTTEDEVDPEKLTLLRNNEALKNLLTNPHLREYLCALDSSENAHKAMKFAMLEPLFIEFANECMRIVEPVEKCVEE
ncbi:zinc finger HIT domain-containing protein 3 [Contarinia nasturtii]|uniref:zinc finger HIT domain-containing protein 3 n=1 Tax=Contarinia nasturtii TaxID=265458 RepID=UPI0012D37CC7|nr:zinc finger HIT domain-containing protein 3 [Contarinia nasturtii]